MKKNADTPRRISGLAGLAWWPVGIAVTLSACGGGGGQGDTASAASASLATGVSTLQLEAATLPLEAAARLATPAFHAAPLLLDVPDDADALDHAASARLQPHTQALASGTETVSTRRLTAQTIEATQRARAQRLDATEAHGTTDGSVKPMAAGNTVSTYTPAQIRAAYGLPPLPAAGAAISAAMAARLGAGQTIYIVDAQHDPNAIAELAAFNKKFGLPACTTRAIAPSAKLPLAPASATACEISVVYNTAVGGMTATAPAYDAGWATEIALDMQWAHATAPLARIVLIEAADASLGSLLGGIKLANAMGPGVVSMSFGADEGGYTESIDSAFSGTNMTYLAATGDYGAGVSWPSVSSKVLAVGGTTLGYSGSGMRSEVAWSGTGGGTSAYTPAPSYQTTAVPGIANTTFRTVADVAFNADPSTGQYTAVMSPGSSTVQWLSIGGTSLSTPQWAGLVAIANAVRAQAAKPALAAAHKVLYGEIAAVPGTYAAAFADVVQGSHGACSTCTAQRGYDPLTGLGTPNVDSLLSALANGSAGASAPVVTSAAVSGQVGTALSFTVSATAPGPVTYGLTNAPAGMTVSNKGAVQWPVPVAGTYAVTVTVSDPTTGLSGKGLYTVTIAAPPPVVGSASITGKAGVSLSFTVAVSNGKSVTYALVNAPAGMVIGTAGVVSWPKPVAGTYTVTATARDKLTGLVGQGTYRVKIEAAAATAGLVITAPPISGVAGKAVSGVISVAAPGATSVSVSIAGAPMGMTFSISGLAVTAVWPSPVVGSYSLKVQFTDSLGRTAAATVPVVIKAK